MTCTYETTGNQELKCGNGAVVSGTYTIALGPDAKAYSTSATALGNGAQAGSNATGVITRESVAVGAFAGATGDQSTAVGNNSQARGSSSVAIGGDDLDKVATSSYTAVINGTTQTATGAQLFTQLTGSTAIASGTYYSSTAGDGSVALGPQARAGGSVTGSKPGDPWTASGVFDIAIGAQAYATGFSSVAIGTGATATGDASFAIGAAALAEHNDALAFGSGAKALADSSFAMGHNAEAQQLGTIAFGANTVAGAENTIAFGYEAKATAKDSMALGARAVADGEKAIAIGPDSHATAAHDGTAVDFSTVGGHSGNIAGAIGSDAGVVSFGQDIVYQADPGAADGIARDINGKPIVAIGGAGVQRQLQNVAPGPISDTSTDAVNGSQLNVTNQQVMDNTEALDSLHYMSVNSSVTGAGSNRDNDGAIGTDAVAFGPNAAAQGASGVAVGDGVVSGASGQNVAIGSDGTTANSAAAVEGAVAIGRDQQANGDGAVAIGNRNTATGNGSVAIGRASDATGAGSLAMGDTTKATGSRSVAFGSTAQATDDSAIAIGNSTKAGGGLGAIAIGRVAEATGAAALALGASANAAANNAVAIGPSAVATNANSVALGARSLTAAAHTTGAFVIAGSTATAAGLPTTAAGVVSVGQVGAERQIQNVAAGLISDASTDAVNGSQLFATNAAVGTLDGRATVNEGDISDLGDRATINEGDITTLQGDVAGNTTNIASLQDDALLWDPAANGGAGAYSANHGGTGPNKITNVAVGTLAAGSTDAVNGSQLYATNQSIENLGDVVDANKTHYFSVNDNGVQGGNYDNDGATGSEAIAAGYGASASGGQSVSMGVRSLSGGADSIAVGNLASARGIGGVAIGAVSRATSDYGVAIGWDARVEAGAKGVALGYRSRTGATVATTSMVVNGTTYSVAGSTPDGTVSIGGNPIQGAANRTLTNVSAGRVSGTSTDAVNGSQLFATNTAVGTLGDRVTVNEGDIADLDDRVTTNEGDISTLQDDALLWDPTANGGAGAYSANHGGTGPNKITNVADGTAATDAVNKSQLDTVADTANNSVQYDDATKGSITLGGTTSTDGGVTGGTIISNVHQGDLSATSTDAVNGSQLYTTNQNVATNTTNIGDLQTTVAKPITFSGNDNATGPVTAKLGDTVAITGTASTAGTYSGANVKTVTDAATGALSIQLADAPKFGGVTINEGNTGKIGGVTAGTAATDAVNKGQLDAVETSANAGWNVTTAATGSGVVNGTSVANVGPGDTATITAGNNVIATQTGTTVALGVNPVLTGLTSIALTSGPSISSTGIAMGNTKITDLAAGTAATDAVNKSQLDDLSDSAVQYNDATKGTVRWAARHPPMAASPAARSSATCTRAT